MKIPVAAFLFGFVTFDKASSQITYTFTRGGGNELAALTEDETQCYQPYGSCKECSNENSGCNVRIDVACTYEDENNVLRSCIGSRIPDTSPPDNLPFKELEASECQNESDQEIEATIKYRMCNFNSFDFTPNPNESYIKYQGVKLTFSALDATITKESCIEESITKKLNLCQEGPSFRAAIVISMLGDLQKDGKKYCQCYNREMIRALVNAGENPEDPDENPEDPDENPEDPDENPEDPDENPEDPDENPEDPDENPGGPDDNSEEPGNTDENSEEPGNTDGTREPENPSEGSGEVENPCNLANAIITELASPEEYNAKYIELYFYKCGGMIITEDLKIISYTSVAKKPTVMNLQGNYIRDDGFLTICNDMQAEIFYGQGACTLFGGLMSPANLAGTEKIALVKGNVDEHIIIDTFGVLGNNDGESDQFFVNGRVVRRKNELKPLPTYNPDNWYVFPGKCKQEVGPEAMDINKWKDVQSPICPEDLNLFITEIVDLDVGDGTTDRPRYVELYSPRTGDREDGFDFNLKLVIFSSDNEEPHWNSAIPIEYVPRDGFVVVCNDAAKAVYGNKCELTSTDSAGPANSNGNDQIALISGDRDNGWFVVDIYGVIGEDGYDTARDFADSRVIRKLSASSTKAKWSKDDWTICTNDMPDPKLWQSDTCGEALTDLPTDAPTTAMQGDCEFFFTEISDLGDQGFIEIYSTCPGVTISRPISVVAYKEYSIVTEYNLEGMVVPEDGFIIICRNKISHKFAFQDESLVNNRYRFFGVCDIESYRLLGGHGTNSYALEDTSILCDLTSSGCDDRYIDIYGFLRSSLVYSQHKYPGCRAVRKMNGGYGMAWFNADLWEIVCPSVERKPHPGESSDPRVWQEVPLVLFFTEFCDVKNEEEKRFIELYSPNKRDYKISDNLMVMKWDGNSVYPTTVFQSLNGLMINENGFLVLCVDYDFVDSESCDYQTGLNTIVSDSGGDTHFALTSYKDTVCDHIIDIYGYPGTYANGNNQDFTGGRASRNKYSEHYPSILFIIGKWVIQTQGDITCDPGVWNVPPPPPPVDPSDENSSEDKSSKDKNKDKDKDKNKDKNKKQRRQLRAIK